MERSHTTVLLCLLRNINTLISVNQHFSWPGKSRKCKLFVFVSRTFWRPFIVPVHKNNSGCPVTHFHIKINIKSSSRIKQGLNN